MWGGYKPMICLWCGEETHSDYHLCSLCDEELEESKLIYIEDCKTILGENND